MALYLVVTRCGQVWSLDARRRARGQGREQHWADPGGVATWAVLGVALGVCVGSGKLESPIWTAFFAGMWLVYACWWLVERYAPGEPRVVCDIIANLVHNAALLVIMAQVCIVYACAGWYKIQGSRWQDGTAVYYPLNLDYFSPWPELADRLGNSGLLIMVMTYGTVFMQIAFPFALLNRRAKNLLLFLMIGEHIGIAVLMGLPAFSMAMIAMDSVFLPTAFLLWLGAGTGRVTALLRRVRPARDSEPEPVPVDSSAGGSAPVPGQGRPPAWAEAEATGAKEAKEATEPAERA
jgi:hypothetical protein